MSDDEPQSKPRPRQGSWFSFSLRTLLIVMTICCVVLGLWMKQLIRQRTAVRRFYELTAARHGPFTTMGYRYQGKDGYYKPLAHKWLHPWIREEAFGEVTSVQIMLTPATDADLRYLADVPTVERVRLNHTKVTDRGLRHLLACRKLRILLLDGLPITDDGLGQLVVLTDLEQISLTGTNVTDAGMDHLAKMTNLKHIWLRGTAITETGYARLKSALPGCEIQADVQPHRLPRYSPDYEGVKGGS